MKDLYKDLLKSIKWNDANLLPVVVQDYQSNKVLMMAWMDEIALIKSIKTKKAHYFSRSRNRLWLKGETSGHFQLIKQIQLDCDGDTLLLKVEQIDHIACHTGRESCFYNTLIDNQWLITEPVIKSPEKIYQPKD